MNVWNSVLSSKSLSLAIILFVAAVLRIHNLGDLSLYGDEDHTFLAVRNILENGYPAMPSGMVYVRGIIHLGLAALSAYLFGLSEFSVRFPSVLSSLVVIYLLYRLAKETRGERAAIVTCAVYALSAWDIEMARFARMYEVFLALYLASTLVFYRGFIKGDRKYCAAAGPLFVLTGITHSLGVFLLIFPLSLLIIRKYDIVKKWVLGLFVLLVALITRGYSQFVSNLYSQSYEPLTIAASDKAGPAPTFELVTSLWTSGTEWSAVILAIIILGFCAYLISRAHSARGGGHTHGRSCSRVAPWQLHASFINLE